MAFWWAGKRVRGGMPLQAATGDQQCSNMPASPGLRTPSWAAGQNRVKHLFMHHGTASRAAAALPFIRPCISPALLGLPLGSRLGGLGGRHHGQDNHGKDRPRDGHLARGVENEKVGVGVRWNAWSLGSCEGFSAFGLGCVQGLIAPCQGINGKMGDDQRIRPCHPPEHSGCRQRRP